MIVLYLIVLAGAMYLMSVSRQRGMGARRGWLWFNAWLAAGALFLFSLLTDFSIALVLFPVSVIAIFWLAVNAPYWREVAGFPLGAVLVLTGTVLFV
ncbi:MAG TPA: hypothetical protein VFD71_02205 [Planctomycetota bacterium]|nr:hypothetical protein [Planctomycetota bacterium]